MARIGANTSLPQHLLAELRDKAAQNKVAEKPTVDAGGTSFTDHLRSSLEEVNKSIEVSDKMTTNVATGKDTRVHETMLAAAQAELGFNFAVQVRNKILEAYHEIMRMPV